MAAAVSPASPVRAYTVSVFCWMLVYVATIFGAALALRQGVVPAGPLRYLVAAAPSVPIAGIILAAGRYLRDSDEYIRALFGRRIVVGAGLTFMLTSTWGFMEALIGVPHIELYWVFPLFCVLYQLSALFVRDAR